MAWFDQGDKNKIINNTTDTPEHKSMTDYCYTTVVGVARCLWLPWLLAPIVASDSSNVVAVVLDDLA